jgi:acetyltransferase-like isoleucine patch superfamily enzyme
MPYLTIDPNTPGLGHPADYYTDRDIEIDCRGPLDISPESDWGIGVKVITASHMPGNMSIVKYFSVTVLAGAWICSFAILYNCRIGENAVVALGSVVRSRDVPAGTMVEGNPARVIARLVNGKWEYLDYPIPLEAKK